MAETLIEGDLRVWWIPQVLMPPFYVNVSSFEDAVKLLTVLADYDKFQFEHNVEGDYSNAGGLEVFEGGKWCDWHNEDGDDIDDIVRFDSAHPSTPDAHRRGKQMTDTLTEQVARAILTAQCGDAETVQAEATAAIAAVHDHCPRIKEMQEALVTGEKTLVTLSSLLRKIAEPSEDNLEAAARAYVKTGCEASGIPLLGDDNHEWREFRKTHDPAMRAAITALT